MRYSWFDEYSQVNTYHFNWLGNVRAIFVWRNANFYHLFTNLVVELRANKTADRTKFAPGKFNRFRNFVRRLPKSQASDVPRGNFPQIRFPGVIMGTIVSLPLVRDLVPT